MTKTSPRYPVPIGLNITEEQKKRWSGAAKGEGKSLAAWVRSAADARLRELEYGWEPTSEELVDELLAGADVGEPLLAETPASVPANSRATSGQASTLSEAGDVKDQDVRSSSKPPSAAEPHDAPPQESAELPPAALNPSCVDAPSHWRIPSGLACPACLGVAA